MIKKVALLVFIIFLGVSFAYAQEIDKNKESQVSVGHVYPGEVAVKGFTLKEPGIVKIDAKFARYKKWDKDFVFYGWILESKSRKVAWNSLDDCANVYFDTRGKFNIEKEIELEAGDYEVYYSAMFEDWDRDYKEIDLSDLLEDFFRVILYDEEDEFDFESRNLSMSVRGKPDNFEAHNGMRYIDDISKKAIASFARTKNDESRSKTFSLKEETTINIYSVGEGRRINQYDYGWIYDLKTHEKIWPNDKTDFNHGGGGNKNYKVFQEITLPAGTYQVNYVTDDNHSWEKWNVLPPDDPMFWGILIWPDKEDRDHVQGIEHNPEPLVHLTKVRDDENLSQGFEVQKTMEVRVFCLGEYDDGREYDYGRIVNADNHKTVWKFDGRDAKHAGGADKNRMINEKIQLEKGHYIVYYSTDGSHAYGDWNAAPPFDRRLYGISLWPVQEEDKQYISMFDENEYKSENIVAQIVGVTDNRKLSRSFTIEKPGMYRVYAIGEGDHGDMYDTGWIKNTDNDQIIWELTYRKSSHAGGADKNRMFNGEVYLSKGKYRLYYESDGSHSYRDWNASPPHDEENYGIQIIKK
jgi:hypothetical protein